jgi:hypothetical protein
VALQHFRSARLIVADILNRPIKIKKPFNILFFLVFLGGFILTQVDFDFLAVYALV